MVPGSCCEAPALNRSSASTPRQNPMPMPANFSSWAWKLQKRFDLAGGQRPDCAVVLFRHDVAHALGCSAGAGMLPIVFQIVTVVERELFASRYVPDCDDPNAVLIIHLRFAIGRATMIQ